jgi:hypothetical protein
VITLMDVWTWISMKHGGDAAFDGLRIAAWVPIDHMPIPPGVGTALKEFNVPADRDVRFGEQMLKDEGLRPAVCAARHRHERLPASEDRELLRRW